MMLDWNVYQQQVAAAVGQLARLSPDTARGYRLLSEASHINLFDYDPEGNALSLSLNLPGHEAEDMVISNATHVLQTTNAIHPDDKPLFHQMLDEATREDRSGTFEIRLRLHQESYRWYQIHFAA